MSAKDYRLLAEPLEDRVLPAGSLPWPIARAPLDPQAVFGVYGQFEDAGGLHFHEGIDIVGNPGGPITAVEDGSVAALSALLAAPPNGFLSAASGTHGWNYAHMSPGINPGTNPPTRWRVNPANPDRFGTGWELGLLQPFGGAFPPHLHLDYGSNVADPSRIDGVRRPIDDPLTYLTSANDRTRPTVSNDIHFRRAFDDQGVNNDSRSHRYFHLEDWRARLVVGNQAPMRDAALDAGGRPNPGNFGGTSDIDILASISDRFFRPSGRFNRLNSQVRSFA